MGFNDAHLVVNELVKGKNRFAKASSKDHREVIGSRDSQSLHSLVIMDIRQQIEDILKGIVDRVTNWELSFENFAKISVNLVKLAFE